MMFGPYSNLMFEQHKLLFFFSFLFVCLFICLAVQVFILQEPQPAMALNLFSPLHLCLFLWIFFLWTHVGSLQLLPGLRGIQEVLFSKSNKSLAAPENCSASSLIYVLQIKNLHLSLKRIFI